jgi:predicted transcriptional regulator
VDSAEGEGGADLFLELAGQTRRSMLESLARRPTKMSTLARELDVTVQEVHRNVNRMSEAGLVERKGGVLGLTESGRMIARQITYFLFVEKYSKFMNGHSLAGVPEKFVQRIGVLKNCRLVETVTLVMQELKRLESSASRRLKMAVTQAWPEEGSILIDRASHGVEIWVVVGHNTVFPKNVIDEIVPAIEKLPTAPMQRMVKQLDLALYVADEEAAVMFPNSNGAVDMSAIFIGTDSEFVEWCSDLFDYIWARAGPFDIMKTRIA